MTDENSGEKRKYNFKENLQHIWFYYKWIIVFGSVIVVFLGVALFQSVTNAAPDVNVLYIGTRLVTAVERDKLDASASAFITDINGDGKKTLSMKELTISTPELALTDDGVVDYQYNSDVLQSFQTEVTAGDGAVFIVDESYYKKLLTLEILRPLSSILDEVPEEAFDDGFGIYIKYLDFAYLSGFDQLPRESILCVRHSPADDDVGYGKSEKQYNNNIEFFKALMSYTSPEAYVRETVNLTLASTRKLYSTAQNRIDNSIYGLVKRNDASVIASLNYSEIPIDSRTNELGDTELYLSDEKKERLYKAATEQSVIMILDEIAYAYLSENGALLELNEAVMPEHIPADADTFGARFNRLDAFLLDGLYYADSTTGNSMLCLSAGADEFTKKVFRLLYEYRYN